ncbi:MAG: D-xylose transporter XylE [Bacteroidota bacterium]|nr:D-xylose transporter XylE [Bacteroidota bacterium]
MSNDSIKKNSFYIMGITLVATLGGLLFGYDTAVISGAVGSLNSFFITPLFHDQVHALSVIFQYRITVCLVMIILGTAISAIFFKLFSKKNGLISTILLFAVGAFFMVRMFLQPRILDEETANSLKGFTVSSALIGCILGGTIGGFVSRNMGRKNGLVLAACLFCLSALGASIPDKMNFLCIETINSFIFYRIIGGIGVGLASMLSPMYIAEIAPANIRGKLVSWNQFAIIFGMLVVYFVNYFIAKQGDTSWNITTGWRWMFASGMIPSLIFLILLFFVPETPRYLVMKDKPTKALDLLKKLSGAEAAQSELDDIKESLKTKSAPWLSYGFLVILIGILLSVFQQFVGINVVLYYAPEIFKNMGSATDTALLQTIIVGIVNLSFTVLAIVSVDRFGRKPLMIIGSLGMAVSMFLLGSAFFTQHVGLGALIFMLIYIASFAMSWGPVTWVLLSEIFPNSIRDAMSIAVAAQWIANLVISWTFPMMNDNTWLTGIFHHGFSYWIYGVMGILSALFMWRMVPETKGKSLETMEKLWKK